MKRRTVIRIVEFFVIGVVMGVTEDIIAILVATDAKLTPRILLVAFLVALPFAIFSELIVDHPGFWSKLIKHKKRPLKTKNK